MGRITVDLIRRRAEHNEGMISNLEELALHQQHIEKIELLHRACRNLKILLLQSNLISKIQNLHRLKQLQYLNLALNNVSKVQNLQRCESLEKLDLTMNFIPVSGLLAFHTLRHNEFLRDVYFMGNPCCDWHGYRKYALAVLPALSKLDGEDVKPSERIAARQAFPALHEQLLAELRGEGVDVEAAMTAEDDGADYDSDVEIEDPGYVDPQDGEFKRPWCPATRILEHRENERLEREQEEQKRAGKEGSLFPSSAGAPRRDDFPEIKEGERVFQKNEGEWEFYLDESGDRKSVVLQVQLGKYMDTSLVKADVQPRWARLLVKGRLLQLRLPCDVCPDTSSAQRSKATGRLVLDMPKADAGADLDLACLRVDPHKEAARTENQAASLAERQPNVRRQSRHAQLEESVSKVNLASIAKAPDGKPAASQMRAVHKAHTVACDSENDEDVPPL